MKLQATATYRPRGDLGRYIEANVTPAIRASVQASVKMIENSAKAMCPVDTGALRDSIVSSVEETGKTVVGFVGPTAPYAAFVEFGTGIAGAASPGAASPGAGKGPYSMTWKGMPAQPYMRPALDEARGPVMDLFRREIQIGLR